MLLGVATTAIMVSGFLLGTRRCKKLNALLQTVAGAATNGTQCFYYRDHVFGVALSVPPGDQKPRSPA
jgi:hypothetical protein